MEFLQQILAAFLAQLPIAAVLTFVAKIWLAGRFKVYEEKKIKRYSVMHEKRAEAMAETYGLLARAIKSFDALVVPNNIPSEHVSDNLTLVSRACKCAEDYFYPVRIYFEERFAKDIEALLEKINCESTKFRAKVGHKKRLNVRESQELTSHLEEIKREFGQMRTEFESRIRGILDVD